MQTRKTFIIPSRSLQRGWTSGPDPARVIQRRLISEEQYREANAKVGSIYFIVDVFNDALKIGHSRDPHQRLRQIQIGNPSPLKLAGIVAARRIIEPAIHQLFGGSALEGEWFGDQENTIRSWLQEITFGQPWQRCQWFTAGTKWVNWEWDAKTLTHKTSSAEIR